ncbi:tRNA threonylcarbamoyladenosine biosynthesis protein TsaB [Rhizobium sp. Root274]|uniref:tRNA (adenosine(37)-N6)-threonylcarbamoyltransferase complex dimerization subunit type 1 TsaB n=1 Tax=unclassified Rhizobium TaxID=2613769 RepID=UPI0007146596|nr:MULTISPECIES: tRNA (adenosine(37)-N6)-threonylcarbamoyltransferase complex dimerization subunit type 1 TsaB [unclassified Rhizobium]KQW31918.1 tRNA threonylcarbamoyladenosine biosynthesis protein TsaB [Rhizobium sp. Root1240]KRD33457.1 tRNA threonylcarbamoyladenosine biosynthesis protein TsaB [Rhizobium sp. Root274]
MIVLAIDTAGVDCAAAVFDTNSGKLLASISETIGRGHAERLMAMIEEALKSAGLSLKDVQKIGVTVGPGSFTGIRVGVAAARGLALALGVDCVGVCTLEVLASTVPATDAPVLAAINAHRDEVYVQAFRNGVPEDEPALVTLEDFLSRAARPGTQLVGSASALIADPEAQTEPDHYPIEIVARISATTKAQGKAKPLYLRGPDAKPQTGFAVSRA